MNGELIASDVAVRLLSRELEDAREQIKALESANLDLERNARETADYASDLFLKVHTLCMVAETGHGMVPLGELRNALGLP